VQDGMGLIVRTAGAKRTKAEIKRDFDYLLKMWERVRDLTLKSSAPALVYEEGNLVKRSIRDLYSKDIDSVLVEGEDAYREAKDLMRMLMPSHAKNVQPYREREPIFQKNGIDTQLDAMFSSTVTLKSGGYLVINQTEALVAVDVNSGRSTKERNIEATALKTNLEAAEEVSRQMRLRDLAGLIVIDFIDMDENRNNRAVERKLKESLKADRARIQIGRISHFGLLEMSRQRMRAGIIEGSTITCPMCEGAGLIRSVESTALHVLRAVETEAAKGKSDAFTVTVSPEVAIYILNQKRAHVLGIEGTYGVSIYVETDRDIHGSDHKVEAAASRGTVERTSPVPVAESVAEDKADADAAASDETNNDEEEPKKKRRRRRGRGRGRKDATEENGAAETVDGDADVNVTAETVDASATTEPAGESASEENAGSNADGGEDGDEDKPKRRRRRGRRGGRRNRRTEAGEGEENGEEASSDEASEPNSDTAATTKEPEAEEDAPVLISYSRASEPVVEVAVEKEMPAPTAVVEEPGAEEIIVAEPISEEIAEQADTPAKPSRNGWWRRRTSAD